MHRFTAQLHVANLVFSDDRTVWWTIYSKETKEQYENSVAWVTNAIDIFL